MFDTLKAWLEAALGRAEDVRSEGLGNFGSVTVGLCAQIETAPNAAIPAVAVAGLPQERERLAEVLGLLPWQLGATRGEALEAELDVPPGRWRVWPARGIGLWLGRDSSLPPMARVQTQYDLDLAETVRRLGSYGLWLYEGRVFDGRDWTVSLPLKSLYSLLLTDQPTALCGAFTDRFGSSREAMIFTTGQIRMNHPEHALGWLEIACGLTDD